MMRDFTQDIMKAILTDTTKDLRRARRMGFKKGANKDMPTGGQRVIASVTMIVNMGTVTRLIYRRRDT